MQEKYRVSIDRITIVGETSRRLQLSEVNEILGDGIELKDKKFIYTRQKINNDGELIRENGFIVEETHGKWRVDFNPNKAGNIEKDKIKRFVSKLSKVHLSRVDIAFDMFNNPLAMKYRLYRKNVSELQIETYKGRAQNIETIYWGSRKSLEQVRLYNKLIEQKKNDVIVRPEITDWARLELQL
ncbi:MAG: replication initiation factor domain-containing protein, partial [Leuconostoc mesenteroides]